MLSPVNTARRLSSGVEQLTRNEQVRGSNPRGGSDVKSRDTVSRCLATSSMSGGSSLAAAALGTAFGWAGWALRWLSARVGSRVRLNRSGFRS